MALKVISSHNESDFRGDIANLFYNHFNPDDWDYLIIGEDMNEVEDLAYKLKVYSYQMKQIVFSNYEDGIKWVAVTYHG